MAARQTSLLTWGVLLGLLATLGVYFGVLRNKPALPAPPQQAGFAVTEAACREIGAAIADLEKNNGRRPERLEDMVAAKLLRESALRDERRPAAPAAFKGHPLHDVTYFRLRPGDAGDLVLLSTLVLREGENRYHVITNDGQYRAMARSELITALNRTYTAIGKDIPMHRAE